MKIKVTAVLAVLLSLSGLAHAQTINGQAIAVQYNNWSVKGTTNLVAGVNTNIRFDACMVSGGATPQFAAFTQTTTPIRITDNQAGTFEIVTPSAVTVGSSCLVTMTTTLAHTTPYTITSGTYGLQEAINNTTKTGVLNAVLLDAAWFSAGGGASILYNAAGNAYLSPYVISIPPGLSYKWSGTHYIATYAINGFTGTFAAGAAAGTSPTLTPSAGNSGNVATIALTTGTATTTGTLFTFTSTASPNTSGNLNCSVNSVGPNSPPTLTVTATSTTVCTVSVATAPATATAFLINVTAE